MQRSSIDSASSGRPSLDIPANGSSQALILVNDDDDQLAPFELYSDDDDELDSPPFENAHRLALVPPLTASNVFIYLLVPFLRLGALLLPNTGLPLQYGLVALLVFAALSAMSRHLLYMLARYFRRADLEDVVTDVLAKGRGRERQREILRSFIRGATGTLRVVLSTLYLRESVNILLPFLPADLPIDIPTPVLRIGSALLILPFILAQTLASKRVIYATWMSAGTYIAWLGVAIYAHTNGVLRANPSWLRLGAFWQGISTTAFVFSSASTLSLYASLKAAPHSVSTTKSSTPRSFKMLCIISTAVAVLLTLPSVLFAASPNHPVAKEAPKSYLDLALALLTSLTLLLSVPSILVITPSLPIPERIRRSCAIPISKLTIFIFVVVLSVLPETISAVLSDVALALTLASTYTLPALLHIGTHFIRRPLAIIIPSSPNPFSLPPETSAFDSPPNSANDPLLQRKERSMQRRQLRRRIIWDVGVWVVLIPITIGGFAWAIGTLVGKW